jgi:hypothetical protein
LKVLKKYLNENLERKYIQYFISPIRAFILFILKKNGNLRLCVDYRNFDCITVKNRHSLFLMKEILNCFNGAAIYTKFDFKKIYYRIRIKKGDEWKTAFRIRYGYFEYKVIFFGLANAPAIFQAYINRALAGLIDVSCVAYFNNILIYLINRAEYQQYIRQIFQRLRQYKLYAKLFKYEFSIISVIFLGFVINIRRIKMNESRVEIIIEWPESRSFKNIQIFLDFANFYRRFIRDYSRIAASLNSIFKGNVNGRKIDFFEFKEIARIVFKLLKAFFTRALILIHFDPNRPIKIEINISEFAIIGILL